MNPTTKNQAPAIGITFLGALTIAFIILKLCGVITWSWWWVLAPLWGPWALALVVFIIGAIVIIARAGIRSRRARSRRTR